MGKIRDLQGKRFGRLAVVTRAPNKPGCVNAIWVCQCDCGTIKNIRADVLIREDSTSCGCYQREISSKRLTTHGMSLTPEFSIWGTMIRRCHNQDHPSYKHHGARGIIVCERWRYSFENFYDDMGQRPSKKHSIDRIDNNGPYSPENCRWATSRTQSRNTSYNRMVEMDGVSFCVADWCDMMGVSRHRPYDMKYWNKRSGIKTIEEALRVLYDEWKAES